MNQPWKRSCYNASGAKKSAAGQCWLLCSLFAVGALTGCKAQQLLPPGLLPSAGRNQEPSFESLLEIEAKEDTRRQQTSKMSSTRGLLAGAERRSSDVRQASATELDTEDSDDESPEVQSLAQRTLAAAAQARSNRSSSKESAADLSMDDARGNDQVADEEDSEPIVIKLSDDAPMERSEVQEVSSGQLPTRKHRSVRDLAMDDMEQSPIAGRPMPEPTANQFARTNTTPVARQFVQKSPVVTASAELPIAKYQASNADQQPIEQAAYEQPRNMDASADVRAQNPNALARDDLSVDELNPEEHLRLAAMKREENDLAIGPEERLKHLKSSRWLYLEAGDIDRAMEPIEGLNADHQGFIHQTMQAWLDATHHPGIADDRRRWTLVGNSLQKAMDSVSAMSDLEILNPVFCKEVVSFGVMTQFANNDFAPDQELLLYCEIENFVAQPVNGGFETELEASYGIYTTDGRRVESQVMPKDSHVCRNRRRDYFIAYRIYLPQKIDAGEYKLQLRIHDVKGDKHGQADIPFKIVK